MTEPNPPHKPAMWYRTLDASSLGIEIAVSVVLGAAAGMWLEKNVTHWSPWTSVLGMGLGVATAARAVVRTARTYKARLAQEARLESKLKADQDAQRQAEQAKAHEPDA